MSEASSQRAPDPAAAGGCPRCGGVWVDGRVALPIVGGLRFVYRLGTTDVSTEVEARMCEGCGHVDLVARDPETIVRARRAAARPTTIRWARAHRSRPGQES